MSSVGLRKQQYIYHFVTQKLSKIWVWNWTNIGPAEHLIVKKLQTNPIINILHLDKSRQLVIFCAILFFLIWYFQNLFYWKMELVSWKVRQRNSAKKMISLFVISSLWLWLSCITKTKKDFHLMLRKVSWGCIIRYNIGSIVFMSPSIICKNDVHGKQKSNEIIKKRAKVIKKK